MKQTYTITTTVRVTADRALSREEQEHLRGNVDTAVWQRRNSGDITGELFQDAGVSEPSVEYPTTVIAEGTPQQIAAFNASQDEWQEVGGPALDRIADGRMTIEETAMAFAERYGEGSEYWQGIVEQTLRDRGHDVGWRAECVACSGTDLDVATPDGPVTLCADETGPSSAIDAASTGIEDAWLGCMATCTACGATDTLENSVDRAASAE